MTVKCGHMEWRPSQRVENIGARTLVEQLFHFSNISFGCRLGQGGLHRDDIGCARRHIGLGGKAGRPRQRPGARHHQPVKMFQTAHGFIMAR